VHKQLSDPVESSTLVELLRHRALHEPDRLAYAYLIDGETEEVTFTYKELDQRARAIGAMLQKMDMTGERALLLYPPGLEYIAAFFGCLYAGVIAVPVYPPRQNQKLLRLKTIVTDAQAKLALATSSILSDIERRFASTPELAALRWLIEKDIPADAGSEWQEPASNVDAPAFIQYTSGSTGDSRGVVLSHSNLMHNLAVIRVGFQIPNESKGIFWLPSYHDMGLIGGVLEPMYVKGPGILMAPASFLQQPVRWLQAITRYRGTISGAPNFAYQMCLDKITAEQRATLDLSSWATAFCGAEPIHHETLRRFAEAFEPCGFRADSFYPCYGLAEATLLASGGLGPGVPKTLVVKAEGLERGDVIEAGPEERGARTLVGCGNALLDQRIVIANPETLTRCAPDQVGEIWVSGPSVGLGYRNRPAETEHTFRAYLQDSGEGPFLRTGDLGFTRDGELVVTGRLKDLIIIRGRNHYPQDIERTVEQVHPALRSGHGATFSVEVAGEERLVIVYEIDRHYRNAGMDEMFEAVRRAVVESHDLQIHALVLVKTLSIPKTSSGKIKRHACRKMFLDETLKAVKAWRSPAAPEAAAGAQVSSVGDGITGVAARAGGEAWSAAELEAWLISRIAALTGIDSKMTDSRRPFLEYGLDSVQAVALAGELETLLKRSLSATLVWSYPNIESLARHLSREAGVEVRGLAPVPPVKPEEETFAIIGLGCRFPGAENPEAFWRLLRDGTDAVTELSVERRELYPFNDSDLETPGGASVRWGGFLREVDKFDPHFFGISPREAARMDPQQRLLLEVAWEALEDAGQAPQRLGATNTGVFVGISSNDYGRIQLGHHTLIDAYTGTGNALSIAANRLSYLLDLKGPSMAIDTACSSSLVAVHLACKSLGAGECDLALVGGVNLILSPELTITFSRARMMAGDGRCKTFDADADGYVRSEGCGVIILKRLSDALENKDHIVALIKGSAVNQDGRSNGLTAPNELSQQEVIRKALEKAGAAPGQISYVETHGTGTPLGDPIEFEALKTVYMQGRVPAQPCALGSVKTNIGHLEAAAGIASLMKVALALQNEEIPPHLHLKKLNPYISLAETAFTIPTARQAWPKGAVPRLAGVSSFGFGGTNAHVILGEAPSLEREACEAERPLHVLTVSAQSESALRALAGRYAAHLAASPAMSVADVCFTANAGRVHFKHRVAVTTASATHLRELLSAFAAGETTGGHTGQAPGGIRPRVVFLFTGQGPQYVGMGRRLYDTQPAFRQALTRCDHILRPYLERPLLSALYPEAGETSLLDETAYTQPALFALEYALAELWQSWGVVPSAVMGHSVGEYVAACVAGAFGLEEGLRLVAERARLMQALPERGMMAAVFAGRAGVAEILSSFGGRAVIAAVNGPHHTVISGEQEALQTVLQRMEDEGMSASPLRVSHAFHSPLIEPMLDAFEGVARHVRYESLRVPLISNLTGRTLEVGEKVDAPYWRRHARETVLFSAGVQTLAEQGYEVFVEIGPTPSMINMGERCLSGGAQTWLPSLKRGHDDWRVLIESVAELHVKGVDLDWAAFDRGYQRQRVSLPTYPFERERYWLDIEETAGKHHYQPQAPRTSSNGHQHPLLGAHLQLASPPGCHIWQVKLDKRSLTYLNDHQIVGQTVLPTSVYVEMIQAAAAQAFGAGQHTLAELELVKALFLPEGSSPVIQIIITPDGNGEASFGVYSSTAGNELRAEAWNLHASGRVSSQ
jgi:acyl transferase domain-containing protein/acyl-CoA synthetase (AMP-forming)/AMP-acid ligase II/acyl carrier protein